MAYILLQIASKMRVLMPGGQARKQSNESAILVTRLNRCRRIVYSRDSALIAMSRKNYRLPVGIMSRISTVDLSSNRLRRGRIAMISPERACQL